MKFINPSVEYWEQAPDLSGVWSQIAKATRVCYQSQQRKNETDEEFVKRVILKPAQNKDGSYNFNKMHGAMLEHGTVYLTIPANEFDRKGFNKLCSNKFTKGLKDIVGSNPKAYITTNMRVLFENNLMDYLKYIVNQTENHVFKRFTFSVITDIGVTREMNRHRTFSVAEQSTRYCDFNKDKFGGELTFIRPNWEMNEKAWGEYQIACENAEYAYQELREQGWKPEQARQVLPLGLKTQAVYTAFADDWQHFLKLRADNVSGKVHPNIAIIANMIKDKFNEITNN